MRKKIDLKIEDRLGEVAKQSVRPKFFHKIRAKIQERAGEAKQFKKLFLKLRAVWRIDFSDDK